jgi:hypothetical protein
MNDIDRLTLQLFTGRDRYNKVLKHSNVNEYNENQQYIQSCRKYKRRILEITEQLLNNPYIPISNDTNTAFEEYSRIFIRYFENKDYEKQMELSDTGLGNSERDDADEDIDINDEDTMFHNMDADDEYREQEESEEGQGEEYRSIHAGSVSLPPSYWGKSIKKMNPNMRMDLFMRMSCNHHNRAVDPETVIEPNDA